jgi:hypothetical protein
MKDRTKDFISCFQNRTADFRPTNFSHANSRRDWYFCIPSPLLLKVDSNFIKPNASPGNICSEFSCARNKEVVAAEESQIYNFSDLTVIESTSSQKIGSKIEKMIDKNLFLKDQKKLKKMKM